MKILTRIGHILTYGALTTITFGTHIYILVKGGMPQSMILPHAALNIAGGILIVVGQGLVWAEQ